MLAGQAAPPHTGHMPITPVPSQTRRVHVYELVNRTKLESLLVVSSDRADAVLARLRRQPPPEAGFWQIGDDVAIETLGEHMAEPSADQFIRQYLEHMSRRTWRFRIWKA